MLWIGGQAASKACDRVSRPAATPLAHGFLTPSIFFDPKNPKPEKTNRARLRAKIFFLPRLAIVLALGFAQASGHRPSQRNEVGCVGYRQASQQARDKKGQKAHMAR